jgi:hypothetical protein
MEFTGIHCTMNDGNFLPGNIITLDQHPLCVFTVTNDLIRETIGSSFERQEYALPELRFDVGILLPIGVMTGDKNRNGEFPDDKDTAWAGMNIQRVQAKFFYYSIGI